MKIGHRLVFSVLMLVIGLLIAKPSQALANYYDGGYKVILNLGSSGLIETQNPYVSSNGSSSAWVMSAAPGPYNPPAQNYVQSGWAKDAGFSGPQYFVEYSSDVTGLWDIRYIGAASVGSTNRYEVSFDNTGGAAMRVNGTDYLYASGSTLQWLPTHIEFLGEIYDPSDQSPGSNYNPVSFGGLYYKDTSQSWHSNPLCYKWADLSTQRNNILSSGSSQWEIWDSRY